ncbi:MAG: DNA polymerase III subunit delta [Dehalococcoidia bacterium]|nr:DNA polymerase III subunit delta [Dehalococcoidia bacterium]
MIYLFVGKDTFSRKTALEALKASVGDPESRDANTTVLASAGLTPGRLLTACQAMPFLAERRLVIVDGLLEEFNERERGRGAQGAQMGQGRGRRTPRDPAEWERLTEVLKALPPSTDLVFVEDSVTARNPLLNAVKAVATTRQFEPPPPEQLRKWLAEEAQKRGTPMTPNAQLLLVDMIGPDMWRLDNELEKLSLHATGRSITDQDVTAMVSSTREVSVFAAVDAIVERNAPLALRHVQSLLQANEEANHILFMLARQVRLLLLAQEMTCSHIPMQEMGQRLGLVQEFPLRKTLEQARRYPWSQLVRFHDLLLETDIAIKTGTLEEEVALEVLIAEVCSTDVVAGARIEP